MLQDDNPTIRADAAQGLAQFDGRKRLQQLRDAIRAENNPSVKEILEDSLRRLAAFDRNIPQ